MKPLLFLLLALLTAAHAAEPAKQQAFGPIQFGEHQLDAEAHLRSVVDDLKKRPQATLTAVDIAREFVTSETRQAPKLAAQYEKTAIALSLAAGHGFTTIAMQTQVTGDAAKLKVDWEVMRDIAESKFGPPAASTTFPDLKDLQRGPFTTDEWTTATGIRVRLKVHYYAADKFSVNLSASDLPSSSSLGATVRRVHNAAMP